MAGIWIPLAAELRVTNEKGSSMALVSSKGLIATGRFPLGAVLFY
jgi:hypothetical protein